MRGVIVLTEMKDNDFCGAGGDQACFLAEISYILPFVSLVVIDSTVSSLLEKISSSFDLKDLPTT